MLGLATEKEDGNLSQAQLFYRAEPRPVPGRGESHRRGLCAVRAGQPGTRICPAGEMLDAAAAVLKTTRLPFDAIEHAYYERVIAAHLLTGSLGRIVLV